MSAKKENEYIGLRSAGGAPIPPRSAVGPQSPNRNLHAYAVPAECLSSLSAAGPSKPRKCKHRKTLSAPPRRRA